MDKNRAMLLIRKHIVDAKLGVFRWRRHENFVFEYLSQIGINHPEDIPTDAENANSLDEAIINYIMNDEYDIEAIMKEIEQAARLNDGD